MHRHNSRKRPRTLGAKRHTNEVLVRIETDAWQVDELSAGGADIGAGRRSLGVLGGEPAW
jgi:hypothetical protein